MNEKAKTVHEVAKLTGITARTLHYYDKIGLLKPSIITEAKYRQYTDDDLTRLQEILFFREVGFALKEIKELLDSPHYVRSEALERHVLLFFLLSQIAQNAIFTFFPAFCRCSTSSSATCSFLFSVIPNSTLLLLIAPPK